MKAKILRFFLLTAILAPAVTRAANQTVNNLGDTGLASQLRQKINACQSGTNPGGAITFSVAGMITLDPNNGPLPTISKNVTINGGGAVEISGKDAIRIFNVAAGATLTLNNITISHGFSGGDDGGAISNLGTLNVVNNSKLFQNGVGNGWSGGAILSWGVLNITNSEIAYNYGGGGAVKPRSSGAITTISGGNFHDNNTSDAGGGGYGGAMQLHDAPSVTVDSSTFTNNSAPHGGAIYVNVNSTLAVTNTTFITNSAIFEGGAINNDGNLTLSDNVILTGNNLPPGGLGGAIRNAGTAELTDVTISDNTIRSGGVSYGGGIFNAGAVTLRNVTLSGNTCPDTAQGAGGGLYNYFSGKYAELTNVTISGNLAGRVGGGIYTAAPLDLMNVTIVGNSSGTGGGIYQGANGPPNFTNTIFAQSKSGGNCALTYFNYYDNSVLSDDNTCNFGNGLDGVTDLLLGPLADNGGFTKTHLPQAGSRAIDSGIPYGQGPAPATDQRGVKRPQGARFDVGAVEVVEPIVENGHGFVQYDGWRGFKNNSANGGFYRMSNVTADAVTYKFTGTSIKWITRKGPNMGKAFVSIDGGTSSIIDLYNSSTLWNQQILFGNLTNAAHTIVIKVGGLKNASATDYNVALDGFLVGTSTTPVQESALAIQYNNWLGKKQTTASGASYRLGGNGSLSETVLFRFKGTSIDFITALGPSYGYVSVLIDGNPVAADLDLYSPTQQWKHSLYYRDLANTNHTIEVRPEHIKNASSTGYGVVVDAFTGQFTALQ
jgi:predicted outer membrane repeat protein